MIINENVKKFEEGKTYMFVADKIQARNVNKWADIINGLIVNVKSPELGFITMNRPNRKSKEMPILPGFCYEIN